MDREDRSRREERCGEETVMDADEDWVGFFEDLGVTAWRAFLACLAGAFFVGLGVGVML